MATKQRIPSPADALTTGINAFDDLADAIANPDPSRPLRNAIGASGRGFCNLVGATPEAARTALGPGFGLGTLVCKPYWDKNNFSAPVEEAPYTGGQCNKLYRIFAQGTADILSCSTGAVTGNRTRARTEFGSPKTGPITAVYLVPGGTTNCGAANFNIRWEGPNVETNGADNFFSPGVSGSSRMEVTGFTVEVVPVDGVDNCGNPGDDLRPGPNPPPNPPSFPPGEEPGVDPDGQPFFFVPPVPPVVPGTDPTDVPPITPPPGGGGGGTPPGPAEPGDPDEGVEPEGEAPEGKEIYALVIDFLTVPSYAREIESGLFVSPCRVFLGTDFGLDLDEAGRAMRSGQAVFAETDGLTRWRVSASVGFTVRVTPYYREKAT
jgi:hypothetical protein